MKLQKVLLFCVVVSTLVWGSGCLLGLAAAIRWDQRRANKMKENARVKEAEGKATGKEIDSTPKR